MVIAAVSSHGSAYVVCPEGDIVFIPAENCNQFYFCTDGTLTALLDCAEGQNFNPVDEVCDADYECTNEQNPDTTTSPPAVPTTTAATTVTTQQNPGSTSGFLEVLRPDVPCPSQGFAYKIHHTYCNFFYYCRDGEEILQQCAFLYRFDSIQGRCLYRDEAICYASAQMVLEVIT